MTTTVNQPGWGWDDAPAKTMTSPDLGATIKEEWKWEEDKPVKVAELTIRKFKTSELPLSSATRTAIESLSHKFKKKGGYDIIRKQVWKQLENSQFEHDLVDKVKNVAIATLESNPSLLSTTRKKSAILVEGHIERSEVYQEAENYIRNFVEQHREAIESGIRALRVAEVGEMNAGAEQSLGSKTDEDYAEETARLREAREARREEERKEQEAIEEAKRIKQEKLQKIEDDKRRNDREARDLARKEKREAMAKAYGGEPGSANTEPVGPRERGRYDDRGHGRSGRGGSRGRGGSIGRGRGSRDTSRAETRTAPSGPRVEKILSRAEQDRLEQEAMAELLRDGKKVSRNRYKAEPDIDETLAPPPRKAMPSSAIKPIDRDPPPIKKEITVKHEDRDIKSERPASRFDIKQREDIDRRDKPRERSRDRGYSRRSSRDRDPRSRRSSRGGRSRDGRRRDERTYDDRDRDRRSARDVRDVKDPRDRDTKRDSRFDDREARRRPTSRTRSRSPRKESTSKPIAPIDPARDPVLGLKEGAVTGRKFIDRQAEEQKLIEIRSREAEARAFLKQREEAKAKGLPMPGYDRPGIEKEIHDRSRETLGSGTPVGRDRDSRSSRPDWGGQRGGSFEARKRDIDSAFAVPGPRDKDFGTRGRREGTAMSMDRPPSRGGPFRSRENTPIPVAPRRESMVSVRTLADVARDAREARLSSPALAREVKPNVPGPAVNYHARRDSTEAGEIIAGAPEPYEGTRSVRRNKSRSRSRDRRRDERDEREKPRSDQREGRRRDERETERRDDVRVKREERDDRRDGRREDARRDERRPRSRSRDRERRYRSRSRDARRPRDSGRGFGGRR